MRVKAVQGPRQPPGPGNRPDHGAGRQHDLAHGAGHAEEQRGNECHRVYGRGQQSAVTNAKTISTGIASFCH